MSELSHYGDGRVLDSLVLPCTAAAAEAELRSLFHQLSSHGAFASEFFLGSGPARPDFSELFACWVQRLRAHVTADSEKREVWEERIDAPVRWLPLCPDLKHRIKKLITIMVTAKSFGSEKPDNFVLKWKCDSLRNVLLTLKSVAADPCDTVGPNLEFLVQIIRARNVLFLRPEEISMSEMEEFPYRSVIVV